MKIPEDAWLLRVHLGEDDRFEGRPLYESIVLEARALHLAGATVLRGSMGFGAASRLHTAKLLAISSDLPIVVEIVDRKEKVDELLERIEPMMQGGLVTLERVKVIRYQPPPDA